MREGRAADQVEAVLMLEGAAAARVEEAAGRMEGRVGQAVGVRVEEDRAVAVVEVPITRNSHSYFSLPD